MTTTLYTPETGFDKAAIMRRAHEIRLFWANSAWGAKPGDMAAAMKKAWRQAKGQKEEIAERAQRAAFLAAETAPQRTARHAELAAQVAWAEAA